MPDSTVIHWAAAGVVAALNTAGGVVGLLRWRKDIPQFVKWGYPPYWPAVTYALKVIGAVMVFVPPLHMAGLVLLALIALAALGTVLYHREAKLQHIGPTVLIMAGVTIAALIPAT